MFLLSVLALGCRSGGPGCFTAASPAAVQYRTQSPGIPPIEGPVPPAGALDGSSAVPPEVLPSPGQPETLGPVLDVRITGNKKVRELEIRRHIQTRKDRNYDPQLVQEDLRRLYGTNKFHNVRVHKDVTPQGIIITFEVLERAIIDDVLFIGNRFVSDKKLLKESGLTKGDALNIYTVQEARRKVEEYYHSKGHSRTRVTVAEGDKPTDRRVVLRIDEGPVERIWKVCFIGNDPELATDARLKTQVKSKPGFLKYLFRGRIDHDMIAEDIEHLTEYYRGLGYFRARVSREIEYDASGQWATLNFVIDEGPRYRIRTRSLVGNKKFQTAELEGLLKVQEGDYFNLEKMQRDENALRELYGGHGHIFADIKASPRYLDEPAQLDLVYQIEEGGLFRVGEINIKVAGEYPHTRRSVVLNRLSFQPGEIIDIREVRNSERRLKASQLFITNPAEGEPPRIVIRPPDLAEAAAIAEKQGGYRGQSPDGGQDGPPTRWMVLDILLPPFRDNQH